ncbi:MAG TPA: hypothetical protein VHC49_14110 [Mycobacteriales bacterium]|nr:hypothetical protein [Mycobacteriales bacterium]
MNSWIDLHALWRIVVIGLVCGAGLPAVFAIGLRALHLGAAEDSEELVGSNPVGLAAAGLCFAVVLAAVGWGIYLIVDGS